MCYKLRKQESETVSRQYGDWQCLDVIGIPWGDFQMRASDLYPIGKVVLRDVALRDALITAKSYPDTGGKIEWIRLQHEAGLRNFVIGAFMPESSFPQYADTANLISLVKTLDGAFGAVMTLSEKGVREALVSGVPEINCVVSASDVHSRRNVHRTIEEALETVRNACVQREAKAHRPVISVSVAVAFGCPISGPIEDDRVLEIVEKCISAGVDIIGLSDTAGCAVPAQVSRLVTRARELADTRPVSIHLHDTRGLGLVNASAAIDAGATIIDASLGGVGGSTVLRGAKGNVVLEDLAYLCEIKGVDAGVDLDKLLVARQAAAKIMPGEAMHGALIKSGRPTFEQQ